MAVGALMRTVLQSGLIVLNMFIAGAVSAQTPVPSAAPLPGANSFAEPQARRLIESQGFSEVSPLVNDKQGIWHGTAKSGTGKVQVSVDYKGNVSAHPQ